MRIEESLLFDGCKTCNRFVLNVKRQTYLYPCGTETVVKVTCKHERECIKEAKRQIEMERKKHENE